MLGPGVVGVVGEPIPQARIVSIGDLLGRLRELADKWEDEAAVNRFHHDDAWCVSRYECAEELREVLRG
jgi:hypothetical protein